MHPHTTHSRHFVMLQAVTLLCCVLFCAAATASSSGSIDIRVSRLHLNVQVRADGSSIETTELVQQLNSPRAVHQAGQIKIPYSASLDDFQILDAHTLKRGGERIAVEPKSIFIQDGLISESGVTSFQDVKTTVIVFPALEPGDSIVLRSQRTRKKPLQAGAFTWTQVFESGTVYDDIAIVVSAPKSLPLTMQAHGLKAIPAKTTGDLNTWRWSHRNARAEWQEEDVVDPLMYQPRLLLSSLRSYSELGAAIGKHFVGKATVTESIRNTALDIVRNARTPQERVQLIHEWVSRNIRYFAIVLDLGGYIPRTAEEVLKSRFGDCKDHAVVLQALLSALGIESVPALLSTDAIYELPALPVQAAFNHVIVYVPSLKIFLESNTPHTAYGVLPYSDADKPALLLDTAYTLMRTPALKAETNQVTLTSRINIAVDGSASGQDTLSASGASAIAYTGLGDATTGMDPLRLARNILLSAGYVGEGTVAATQLSNRGDFNFSLLYELRDFALFDQPTGVLAQSPMSFMAQQARVDISSAAKRTVPYVCGAITQTERMEITFPVGTRLSLPKNVHINTGAHSYQATYKLVGSTVQVDRRYTARHTRGTCSPEEFQISRRLQEKILRDLRNEIQYQRPITSSQTSP